MPAEGALLDQPASCLATEEGDFQMVFEDAGQSGFFRPEWKFHVWLEQENGFPFLGEERLLYAVIFYDGDGEISIRWDNEGRLSLQGGVGVKDILYPWAKGTVGRGNPYHEIQGVEWGENGVKYADYTGFVGYGPSGS